MASLERKPINTAVLRQCREQMALDLKTAATKAGVPKLKDIEAGHIDPTFRQVRNLASRYEVPSWVFSEAQLPREYRLDRMVPDFRQFAQSKTGVSYRTRRIISNVVLRRDLILSLRDEKVFPIEKFSPPDIKGKSIEEMALGIRDWLGVAPQANYTFDRWRELCEKRDIFILTTSTGWSFAKKDFRGIAIYKEKLPMIIINNSDYLKAQSFTLFYELGHLLQRKNSIDGFGETKSQPAIERWCDSFASELLVPKEKAKKHITDLPRNQNPNRQLPIIERTARKFKVSPATCAKCLCCNHYLTWNSYGEIRDSLAETALEKIEKYRKPKKSRLDAAKAKPRGMRQSYKSTVRRYGNIYFSTMLQAYYDEEITLAKLYRLMEIKDLVCPSELQKLCL